MLRGRNLSVRRKSAPALIESLEVRRLLSYSSADLNGTWTYASDSAAGTLEFDGAGNIIGGTGTTASGAAYSAGGTYAVDNRGSITANVTGIGQLEGAINSYEDVAIFSSNSPGYFGMAIYSAGVSYSNTDISGTWNIQLNANSTSDNLAGTISFDADGNITGGSLIVANTGQIQTITGGTYTINSNGSVTITPTITGQSAVTFAGAMNVSKDVIAMSPTNLEAQSTGDGEVLAVLTRSAGQYSNASVTGTWTIAGDGLIGAITFNGTDGVTGGTVFTQGTTYTVSGTDFVDSSGNFTATLHFAGAGNPIPILLIGTLNAGDNTIALSSSSSFSTYEVNVLTNAGRPSATLPPASVTATQGTLSHHVAVTWSAVTGATSYAVYRGTSDDFDLATSIATGITGTVYNDTTVTPGQTYFYWIRPSDSGVLGMLSAPASGYIPSSVPTDIAASQGTLAHHVQITWNPAEGATGYKVFRNTTDDFSTATQIASGLTTTDYIDTTATVGQLYYYWVEDTSAGGTSAPDGPATGYLPLPAPGGVAASQGTSSSQVQITWDSVTGASSYQIFRSDTDNFALAVKIAAGVTADLYDDTTAVAGQTYYYWIRARDAAGPGLASAAVSGYVS